MQSNLNCRQSNKLISKYEGTCKKEGNGSIMLCSQVLEGQDVSATGVQRGAQEAGSGGGGLLGGGSPPPCLPLINYKLIRALPTRLQPAGLNTNKASVYYRGQQAPCLFNASRS